MLKKFGDVVVFDFEEVRPLTAYQFMYYLRNNMNVTHLLKGYDHSFGSDCLRDLDAYQRQGRRADVDVLPAPSLTFDDAPISSSRIRDLIQKGDILDADTMLGYCYTITGKVIHGNGIGRTIGFPTANIEYPLTKVLPRAGVYSAFVTINEDADPCISLPSEKEYLSDPRTHLAVVNVGTNPTIGNVQTTIEAYLLDFSGDIYGKSLTIRFRNFIRPEQHFDTIQDLAKQIKTDISHAQEINFTLL